CDELTHWRSKKMWEAASSSYAKKNGVLIVACNAGYGTDWQWDIRERAKKLHGKTWHFSCPMGPAPWRTQEELEEQEALLPYNEYRRLWWNEWQSSGGQFVMLEDAESCVDPKLKRQ